jgi:hypothetical protein
MPILEEEFGDRNLPLFLSHAVCRLARRGLLVGFLVSHEAEYLSISFSISSEKRVHSKSITFSERSLEFFIFGKKVRYSPSTRKAHAP